MTDFVNNLVVTIMGKVTGFALRRFPRVRFEAVPIPAKAGEKDGTGRSTMPHDVLLVTAKGGTGAALDEGIEAAVASAIRFADFQAAGQEIPKGKISDKYREQARADINVILKEHGLTRDAWLGHLDAFILNAGPQKAQTTVRINPGKEGFGIECRLLLSNTENMGRALKHWPNAVSTEKEGTPYHGMTLAEVYKTFNAETQKLDAEKKVESLAEKAARLSEKLAEIKAEQEKLQKVSGQK